MDNPFPIFLGLFAVVAIAVIAVGVKNGRKAMLDRLVPLEGETTLLELEVRYAALPFQRALINSMVYQRGRVRVTDRRIVVAQHGLGSEACVVRYVGYRRGEPPSDLEYGYPCFALLPPTEVDEKGVRELRLMPRERAPIFPCWVGIRSERLDEIMRLLPTAAPPPRGTRVDAGGTT